MPFALSGLQRNAMQVEIVGHFAVLGVRYFGTCHPGYD